MLTYSEISTWMTLNKALKTFYKQDRNLFIFRNLGCKLFQENNYTLGR